MSRLRLIVMDRFWPKQSKPQGMDSLIMRNRGTARVYRSYRSNWWSRPGRVDDSCRLGSAFLWKKSSAVGSPSCRSYIVATATGVAFLPETITSSVAGAPIMDTDELLKRYAKGRRDFRGVILRGLNLHEADLSGTDLREADLTGAMLSGADLSNAN